MQPYKFPLRLPSSASTSSARRAPRSARSFFRRSSTANSSERATAGAAGTTSITTSGFTRERLSTGSHTTRHVSVEIRPARQSSARTVIYSRHESHAVRPADRFHINNRTLLSHDDAAAPHQVAHRRVRGWHPRPPITPRSSKPPRRLGRSARFAGATRLENAQRLRRELGLAGALRRRWRLVGARTLLTRRGQLVEYARGRHPAVRVEDDSFGF